MGVVATSEHFTFVGNAHGMVTAKRHFDNVSPRNCHEFGPGTIDFVPNRELAV